MAEVSKEAELLKTKGPLPEASIVALRVLPPILNKRSVLAPPPVYCSVPPSISSLAAALDEAPMPLAEPPLARIPTLSTPPLTVVPPE